MAASPEQYRNDFLSALPKPDYDLIIPHLVSVFLEQHTLIDGPLSEVKTVYFPAGGILSVVTIMEDGEGVEACTIGHESAYGLAHALGSSASIDRVVVQVAGEAFTLPTAALRAAAHQSPALINLIMRHVQANTAQTQQSVACNALHLLDARLCRWLLMSRDRTGAPKLRLTQEYLSLMLGVQRTTVTRAATAMQAAGLIRYSRGQIEVLDRAGLEAGACECYVAVKQKHARLLGSASPAP